MSDILKGNLEFLYKNPYIFREYLLFNILVNNQ